MDDDVSPDKVTTLAPLFGFADATPCLLRLLELDDPALRLPARLDFLLRLDLEVFADHGEIPN